MTCPDCLKAKVSHRWAGYRSDCAQCQIRSIANAPRHIRDQRYSQIEKACGQAAAHELKQSVREEYARLQALNGKTTKGTK